MHDTSKAGCVSSYQSNHPEQLMFYGKIFNTVLFPITSLFVNIILGKCHW
jgi:hypothetical protein